MAAMSGGLQPFCTVLKSTNNQWLFGGSLPVHAKTVVPLS